MPFKSESMGLLDAEGYKFLEASDSNSDEGADKHETGLSPPNELIYEVRPPTQPKKKRDPK